MYVCMYVYMYANLNSSNPDIPLHTGAVLRTLSFPAGNIFAQPSAGRPLTEPYYSCMDAGTGNLYVADFGNNRVVSINPQTGGHDMYPCMHV